MAGLNRSNGTQGKKAKPDYGKPWSSEKRYFAEIFETDKRTGKRSPKASVMKGKIWEIVCLAPKQSVLGLDAMLARRKAQMENFKKHHLVVLCPNGENPDLVAGPLSEEGLQCDTSTDARQSFKLDSEPWAPVVLVHFGVQVSDGNVLALAKESAIEIADFSKES